MLLPQQCHTLSDQFPLLWFLKTVTPTASAIWFLNACSLDIWNTPPQTSWVALYNSRDYPYMVNSTWVTNWLGLVELTSLRLRLGQVQNIKKQGANWVWLNHSNQKQVCILLITWAIKRTSCNLLMWTHLMLLWKW